ncbi:MAG TPA: ketosteroid isomerase-related protein [Acidocella sp.]|nr:ketosteroid isomerase-related protein [Acidocella sp.]
MQTTEQLINAYYAAFNAGDEASFMALLTDDVVHDINQGEREIGKTAFVAFWARMHRCYKETLTDIVVLTNATGDRAAAEFVVHGKYLAADDGLPPARGQTYTLPAGAFFSIRGGKVARISNYYNLPDWIRR